MQCFILGSDNNKFDNRDYHVIRIWIYCKSSKVISSACVQQDISYLFA